MYMYQTCMKHTRKCTKFCPIVCPHYPPKATSQCERCRATPGPDPVREIAVYRDKILVLGGGGGGGGQEGVAVVTSTMGLKRYRRDPEIRCHSQHDTHNFHCMFLGGGGD